MSSGFTHLHLHTQYSLLDGAIRIKDLIAKCKEYNMDAVAITDHGVMLGALEFYLACKAADIKPIIGCEFYIAPMGHTCTDNVPENEKNHLVLLAMNYTGYQNMMHLATVAQLEGYYYKPRIDMELLREYNEGIIALTACIKGEIPWMIFHNDMEGARLKAKEYYDVFGDRLYFELQENGLPAQQGVNDGMKQLASEMGVKLVATNDCHYLNKEDAHAHEILLCIQTGRPVTDPKHFRFSTDEFYFKSPDVMKRAFDHCPEAIVTTQEIVQRCDLEIPLEDYSFPDFPITEGETAGSMFTKACLDGLEDRFNDMRAAGIYTEEKAKQYHDRLDMEMKVIITMDFPTYFLIVADFIIWAKNNDIPVGPGRGSGAGSLAAFCMKITNIDPLPYGLIFERFLNVERINMPDFDVDFCQERRGEVIDYVRRTYGGATQVAQIITYGTMKARGVVRDVGRALDIPLPVVDKVAKLIPDELKMTLVKALDIEPKIKEMAASDPQIAELLKVSQTLEGLARHTSTHAAGVVISPGPMDRFLPLARGSEEKNSDQPGGKKGKKKFTTITQYDGYHTEKTGLIKFDFLGLKTLTVIHKAIQHIKKDKGLDLNIDTIPLDDPETFALLCRGDALGVFQLESSGMRDLVTKMAPEQFSDLIALVALYRPGPLESGMVDDFVNTKHGRKEAVYPLPQLEDVLRETYGVIVYQEQVMKIANILAGYSLGSSDLLRRAMGKKKKEEMEKQKVSFLAGAKNLKVPMDKAEYVFNLMAKFAGYGFNKSHSAAYALVCYQTAWLKAHYMPQFMAGLLSCDKNNTEKVVRYITECRDHDVDVLPPDINESYIDFSVKNDRVRFGLAAIKNVGESALKIIIAEREESGPYRSISDFCNRVDSRRVNSRVIEALIRAGAFDSLGYRRSQYMAVLEQVMEQAKAVQRDKQSGQLSLFGVVSDSEQIIPVTNIIMPSIDEWDEKDKLAWEKDAVGFYITGHPLNDVMSALKTVVDCQIDELKEWPDEGAVRIGGLIKSIKLHRSKKGDAMAFISVEDVFESIEVVIFPRTFEQCSEVLKSEGPIVVLGRVQQEEHGPKIIAESVDTLENARAKYTDSATLKIPANLVNRPLLEKVKNIFFSWHGSVPLKITLDFQDLGEVDVDVLSDLTVRPCQELTMELRKVFPQEKEPVRFHGRPTRIENRKRKWGGARTN
ncbi:DNA polymerase III subunit alpha [Desulforhopalus vacuolatus]|uniref:DNA polymerase III subunit alpha n=1 Tax=Desulforhopalus vacuolatus TaxID=40414 RepID=UPI00196360A0|nr:DNA polymerase III subunit alpha [Desulforhopalus vacuolatus]MBM9519603.1 DNA polymerase III subunit alpha [Desulforhopalus vacuolatus]